MKKTLAILLTVVMAFTCLSTFASAATDSPEAKGVIASATAKDKDNKEVKITISPAKSTVDFSSSLAILKTDANKNDLKVVDQREVTAPAGTVFPITITFNVIGVTSNSVAYFLHKKADGTVEQIKAITGKDTMTGTFNSLSPVALVVDNSTAAAVEVAATTSDATSPKTASDVATPIAMALVCACAVIAGISVKKIKATNC